MCECSGKEINLTTIKIYTFMGSYKAKNKSGISIKDGFRIEWAVATQEELAYAYEELGMTNTIDKLSTTKTKDDKEATTNKKKKSSKKSASTKD